MPYGAASCPGAIRLQLIAVFNATFAEKLSSFQQHLHLISNGLLGIAIAVIITDGAASMAWLAGLVGALYLFLWFILPRLIVFKARCEATRPVCFGAL